MTNPPEKPPPDAAVSLREVSKSNLLQVLRLRVTPEQEAFVAPNAVSIAQAYFDREIAWFRAIYAGETPADPSCCTTSRPLRSTFCGGS